MKGTINHKPVRLWYASDVVLSDLNSNKILLPGCQLSGICTAKKRVLRVIYYSSENDSTDKRQSHLTFFSIRRLQVKTKSINSVIEVTLL